MNKEFKDLFIGQVFDYEFMFNDVFIRGIKKSTRTAEMLLDKEDSFIMYFSKNAEVLETNLFTIV